MSSGGYGKDFPRAKKGLFRIGCSEPFEITVFIGLLLSRPEREKRTVGIVFTNL